MDTTSYRVAEARITSANNCAISAFGWRNLRGSARLGLVYLLSVIFSAAVPALAQTKEVLQFQGISRKGPVTVSADLLLPNDASGPVPAMVVWHGSGGVFQTHEYVYAAELNRMGVAAIVPDSFTARGITSTVGDQEVVSTTHMTVDAFRLLRVLVQHPKLDAKRIGIMGFSKGGTVAFNTALSYWTKNYPEENLRYALHVAFYPGCSYQPFDKRSTSAPIKMLLGANDRYVGTSQCLELTSLLKAAGANIEAVVYPNAQHAWDSVARAWSFASGENYMNCLWVQRADGSWYERTTGITTNGPGERLIPENLKQALAGCRTLGVSGGPDPATRSQSLDDLKRYIREAFQLP